MFSTSGYFKGVNCPYYASGLCERAYCHFRHVKNDGPSKRNAFVATANDKPVQPCVVEPVKKNGFDGKSSLLGMVGNAIKQVQRDIEKDKAIIQQLQPNSKPVANAGVGRPNYSPTPITQASNTSVTKKKLPVQSTYLPPGIPVYKPTPIHLLQRQKSTTNVEYDPVSNSRLSGLQPSERITLADAEQKLAKNRGPEKQVKKEKITEIEAKFSSDEDNEGSGSCNKVDDATINQNKDEFAASSEVLENEGGNSTSHVPEKIKEEKSESGSTSIPDQNESESTEKPEIKEESPATKQKNCAEASETLVKMQPCEKQQEDKNSEEHGRSEGEALQEKSDRAEERASVSGHEKESRVKMKERKERHESHKSGHHKSSRSSNHHHRHGDRHHKQKTSDSSKSRHHTHDSHSSSGKHKQSLSSRHGHVDRKSRDSCKSKRDRHNASETDRRHKHKRSVRDHNRSHHSRKKSKSSHKYKRSDRHHHHHHRHHSKHHSSSKSLSSKRRHRHSSVSSISSFSSSSCDYSSDASYSSFASSVSVSSSSQLSSQSVKHCKPSESKTMDSKLTTATITSLHDSEVNASSAINHISDRDKPEADKSLTACLDKTNMFEKFQRTVSCVDLFGEDSSGDDLLLLDDTETCENGSKSDDGKTNEESKSGRKRKLDDVKHDNDQQMETAKSECESHVTETVDDGLIMKKRRLAHPANPDAMIKRRPNPLAPHRPSPAQIMLNRFKLLQEKTRQSDESSPGASEDASGVTGGKKRVAHAVEGFKPGRTLMKHKPTTTTTTGSSNQADMQKHSTTAGTITKGTSRTAHVPNQKTLKRPIIPAETGSKVPTNIRQRYLNLFVDECLKIYPQSKDAYDRALMEEKAACARASNKSIYLNVAINTLKKLRDEVTKSSDSSDQEVKLPAKNPKALSHAALLGGAKAANTRYTIQRSGGPVKLPAHLTSRQLYILLSRYILTEDQLIENSFPRPVPGQPGHAKLQLPDRIKKMPTNSTEKVCVRCGKRFIVSMDGVYVTQENCIYHWGRCWKRRIAGSLESRFTCCGGDTETAGCQLSQHHVHEQNKYSDLTGYVQTKSVSPPPDGDYKLYAMDCEMVYTLGGCELARVTVIDTNLQPVYEAIVRPEHEVIDYNTRFSGLTADDMKGVKTTIRDVQTKLLSMFNDKTILIGHSLESDLIALKLLHNTVVDTSVVFPHKLGLPYKRALRTLMAEILQKIIQNDVGGHDSKEDAAACMELMIWKARDDAKKVLRNKT